MDQIRQYVVLASREAAWRERQARQFDQLRLAREARCETVGCHPVSERISRALLRMTMRFHCWATPATRQKIALPCGC